MFTVILQLLGVIVFLAGTFLLRKRLRESPTPETAEKASKISHTLYYAGLSFPGALGLIYPGLSNFDAILGIASLPFRQTNLVIGIVLLLGGIILLIASNKSLLSRGKGAAAFKLTKTVVHAGIYAVIRNPMSLGFYVLWLGLGLIAGSTYFVLYSLLLVVPVHIFNLTYFEERELEIRFGVSYLDYKRKTPLFIPRRLSMNRELGSS